MMHSQVRRITAVVLLGTVGGCFVQQPIGLVVPAPQTRIVAQLTDLGSAQMANAVGPGAYEVEGDVYVATADTLKLLMRRVEQRGGISTTWKQELVSFPRASLTGLTEKRLSKGRSWFTAGVIVGGVVLLSKFLRAAAGGIPDRGGTIDPS